MQGMSRNRGNTAHIAVQGTQFNDRSYVFGSINKRNIQKTNLSNLKSEHTAGGSGRGGARQGEGAERGPAGGHADGSVRPGENEIQEVALTFSNLG